MFNELAIGETPTTDPKTIVGRQVQVSMTELGGNPQKFYMKMKFRITEIAGRNAKTEFNGFELLREHLMRVVRKRTQKIETILTITSKDKWKLQITSLLVLNRRTDATIKHVIRKLVTDTLTETITKSTTEEFIKKVVDGSFQKNLRKEGSKLYPIRFCEIAKIEVLKTPAAKPIAATV